MAINGYRTKEPAVLDFAPEKATLAAALIANLTDNMGYGPQDLEQALHLTYSELAAMYDLRPAMGLRRVK